jgi:glycerol-3-phosphate acyltransferase PlsY
MVVQSVVAVLVSYVLGCFCTAYYLVRWQTGEDIRALGSGTAGARNAARVLGAWGFVVSFAGDMGKGSLALLAAQWLGVGPWTEVAAFVAVMLGHLYPIQLGWRGGKGAATAFGGLMILDWRLGLIVLAVAAAAFIVTRAFTLSGLIAIMLAPGIALLVGAEMFVVISVTLAALILLFSHRENIGAIVRRQAFFRR